MYKYLGNTNIELYNLLGFTASVVMTICNLLRYRRKKYFYSGVTASLIEKRAAKKQVSPEKVSTPFVLLEIFLLSVLQYSFVLVTNSIGGTLFNTGLNYFGNLIFAPVLFFLIFRFIKINPFKQFDIMVTSYPLALFVAKMGCFAGGCCAGVEWANGIYNHSTGQCEVPVQLYEAIVSLLIFFVLLVYEKKAQEGTMLPVLLILYSATRFFIEFFKAQPDIIWKLKTYHLVCIFGLIVGIVELIAVKKHKPQLEALFYNFKETSADYLNSFALKTGLKKEKNIEHHKKKNKK